MKRLVLILFLASVCYGTPFYLLNVRGDTFTSHLKPITDSTLDIGTGTLYWRYIYGDSFTDGTALWNASSLLGFTSISGLTLTDTVLGINSGSITSAVDGTFSGTLEGVILTDGTFSVTGGTITSALWHGTAIDISDYTNLVAGTNITLVDDTLNVDDAFLINDGDDTTTGTLTAGGFTTAGTAITDILIVGSNPPPNITSAGTAGTITYDADYLYVAIANNSWKRVALTTAGWGVTGDTMIYEDTNTMVFEDGNTMVYD